MTDALDELYEWMRAHKVLHVTVDGISVTLSDAALFEEREADGPPTYPVDDEDETPHQRIRRLHDAELTRRANGDDR